MPPVDPREYPWGLRDPEPGVYIEWPAACGAEEHVSHPACEPAAFEALRARNDLEIVAGPLLTERGWLALVRATGKSWTV